MNLTEELSRAIAEHPDKPVRLTDPATKREYVLVPAEHYEQAKANFDDSPWTIEERDALRAEAVEALGWAGMEAYQGDEP